MDNRIIFNEVMNTLTIQYHNDNKNYIIMRFTRKMNSKQWHVLNEPDLAVANIPSILILTLIIDRSPPKSDHLVPIRRVAYPLSFLIIRHNYLQNLSDKPINV